MWNSRVRMGLGWVAAAVIAGSFCAGAQAPVPADQVKTTITMPPSPLLPAHVADLTVADVTTGASDKGSSAADSSICSLTASAAAGSQTDGVDCGGLMKEDGLLRTARGTYTRAGGGSVPAYALEFGDATGAYSAYTFFRTQLHASRVLDGDALTGKAHETTTSEAGDLAWAGTAVLWLGSKVSPMS